ncbi:MAG TPA: MurT ligase domain-containing protein [Nocardioidaceae bacterium]|nr:MurT ligase domain-containing protein [Nocardioidaceae bacterium]
MTPDPDRWPTPEPAVPAPAAPETAAPETSRPAAPWPSARPRLGGRARTALAVGRAAAAASRALGRGAGEVIGGRTALLLAPDLLGRLGRDRVLAMVSATNGKTTTTRMLAAALATRAPLARTGAGANMPTGHVAVLASRPLTRPAVLEVDELYLPQSVRVLRPRLVVLLNLSRDQLDRTGETRKVARGWRRILAESGPNAPLVVANADDPLVVWSAGGAARVIWVGVGQPWHDDARSCPACDRLIEFADDVSVRADGAQAIAAGESRPDGWRCTGCALRRPQTAVVLERGRLVHDGQSRDLRLALPGRANQRNAVMAAVAACALGVGYDESLPALARIGAVEGRYAVHRLPGARPSGGRVPSYRLLLGKNPASWAEAFEMLAGATRPLVLVLNARDADGHDTSWLWDVPYERLAARPPGAGPIVVSGERAADLSVRLAYAGVPHRTVPVAAAAIAAATADADPVPDSTGQRADVDVVANYTAFRGLDTTRGRRRTGAHW